MSKFSIAVNQSTIPQMLAFIDTEFQNKPYASAHLNAIQKSAQEIIEAIYTFHPESDSVLINMDIKPTGINMQFMHAGPIFYPCSREHVRCPYTIAQMDELNFEFKYGRNVTSIYKQLINPNAC